MKSILQHAEMCGMGGIMVETNEPWDDACMDDAVARRLARLGTMPVDTTRLERTLRLQIAPPVKARAWKIGGFRPMRAAASFLVLCALGALVLFLASGGPAMASAEKMAALHEEMVSGKMPAVQVSSIEAANKALEADWPQCPDLPGMPQEHAMTCCMKSVKDKKMACLLIQRENVPVSLMVAHSQDMRSPDSPLQTRNGIHYRVQASGKFNMVMTERQGRWICLIGELSVDRLMDVADQLRF